ncbi:B-type lectin plumieribetin-like [Antennarius striatus]|uniref:B-type lectin plumieribetin-like n=1 Tax=Antennarius striatus TaxID=241820 RepID=UPI0035B47932
MSRNYMSKNDELRKGDSLLSNNKMFEAIFQDDGNFVIYTHGKALWATGTDGSDAFRLCLQGNCNLILYNERNDARWSSWSGKLEANMCRLQLTDEGKLELYREAQRIWSSAESTGKKL